jgi:hypothetical protein
VPLCISVLKVCPLSIKIQFLCFITTQNLSSCCNKNKWFSLFTSGKFLHLNTVIDAFLFIYLLAVYDLEKDVKNNLQAQIMW